MNCWHNKRISISPTTDFPWLNSIFVFSLPTCISLCGTVVALLILTVRIHFYNYFTSKINCTCVCRHFQFLCYCSHSGLHRNIVIAMPLTLSLLKDRISSFFGELPIQVPYAHFNSTDLSARRLCATIQIVNRRHTSSPKDANDSFFSLYFDEKFVPTAGGVYIPPVGFSGTCVRFDGNTNELILRGPNIRCGKMYSIATCKNCDRNTYSRRVDRTATTSTDGVCSAQGYCERPGVIIVDVAERDNDTPDMYKLFYIALPSGTCVQINPNTIQVWCACIVWYT